MIFYKQLSFPNLFYADFASRLDSQDLLLCHEITEVFGSRMFPYLMWL